MATITNVTVTITPPGGDPVTLNTSTASALAAGQPSAVDGITVEWGQTTPIDHQEPGRLAFTIAAADPNPFPWESEVVVTASVDGRAPVTIGRGWVNTSTWSPGPNGLWLTRTVCTDVLARAAASKIPADATWPGQVAAARRAAIETAVGWPVFGDEVDPPWVGAAALVKVTPSDSAYDLAARLYMGSQATLVEGVTGIRARMLRTLALIWPSDETPPVDAYIFAYDPPQALTLPASTIVNAGRTADRTAAISRVRYSYLTAAGDRAEVVFANPDPVNGSTAELEISADQGYNPAFASLIASQLKDLMAGLKGVALVALDPTAILLDQLAAPAVENLIAIGTRAGVRITIDDCPADLDPWQTLTAGTLTIAGANGQITATLAATLRPSALAGDRPLRWSDWTTPGDKPADTTATTFDLAGVITARQTANLSTPRSDRYYTA